jgi:Cdc6-like AAA superfamily ATPase
MKKQINPFNPNSIVTPPLFAGRDDQVVLILKKLVQVREGMPASFVLQGDRGIGKTALAKLVMYAAEQKDPKLQNLKFLTAYYVVEKDQTFESALQASINLMTDKMPESMIKRLSQRLGTFFKNGKFSFGAFGANVEYDGASKQEKDMAIKDRAVSAFSNIIAELDEITEPERKLDGVLVVIDEIHSLKDVDGAAQILRAISTTLDVNRRGKISFMVIGYADGIERFFAGDPSARRHFDVINLTVMPRDEAKEILVRGFEKADLAYDKKTLEHNIDVAGGYPHSIQIIGHQLVDVDTDDHIDENDWKKALQMAAVELARKDFLEMYDFNGKGTLRETVLNILALAGPLTKLQLRDFTDGKNIYTETCMGILKKSGAVKELQDGTVMLHSMLFRAAILIHLYTHAQTNKMFDDLIKRFSKNERDQKTRPGEKS